MPIDYLQSASSNRTSPVARFTENAVHPDGCRTSPMSLVSVTAVSRNPPEHVRFPEAAAPSEPFQAHAVVIDDEHGPGVIHHHSGHFRADRFHQRSRLQVDDVPGAFRRYEQVLVVGHQGDRADVHVTDLEAADPRRVAEPDAEERACASGVHALGWDEDDRFVRGRWSVEALGSDQLVERSD
jgi:hypothetical protein